jgi:hypothetical protein
MAWNVLIYSRFYQNIIAKLHISLAGGEGFANEDKEQKD